MKKCIHSGFKGNWGADCADNAMKLTLTADEGGKLTLPRAVLGSFQKINTDKYRGTAFIPETAYSTNKGAKTEQSWY